MTIEELKKLHARFLISRDGIEQFRLIRAFPRLIAIAEAANGYGVMPNESALNEAIQDLADTPL